MKRWGMQEDELSTTHPVAGLVPDTDYAETNFDGVTYGKGAALLKQLVCCVGAAGFRNGVRGYFKKYAWGNTVCADFVGALSEGEARERASATGSSGLGSGSGSGGSSDQKQKLSLDPQQWSTQWLATASMNTLTPTVLYSGSGSENLKQSVIESFVVQQTYKPEYPHLRQHALEVGLYDWNSSLQKPVLRESVMVTIDPKPSTALPQLVGKPRPDFVFINYNDHGFAKLYVERCYRLSVVAVSSFQACNSDDE